MGSSNGREYSNMGLKQFWDFWDTTRQVGAEGEEPYREFRESIKKNVKTFN